MHLCRGIQKREFLVGVSRVGGERMSSMEYQSEGHESFSKIFSSLISQVASIPSPFQSEL